MCALVKSCKMWSPSALVKTWCDWSSPALANVLLLCSRPGSCPAHFFSRTSDRTGWYLRSDFQFSVGPMVRTYTMNYTFYYYSEFREQRLRFDLPAQASFFFRGFFTESQ